MALHSISMPSSKAVKECLDLLWFMLCQSGAQKYQSAYSSKLPSSVNLILTSGKLCDSEINLKFITAAYRPKNA
jgi:PIN domain nuclease of toxin-antitoxin system